MMKRFFLIVIIPSLSLANAPDSIQDQQAAKAHAKAQNLTSASRNYDPFGLPPARPISQSHSPVTDSFGVHSEGSAAAVVAVVQPEITAGMALASLPVDGIDPLNKEFYVGQRSIYQGDHMTVLYSGRTFRLLVVEVRPNVIYFKDIDTDETQRVDISIIPSTADFPVMEAP